MKNLRLMAGILAVSLITSSGSFAKSYHFDYQKNIDVSGEIELLISNTSGLIEVTGEPVERVTINATKHVRATDLDEAEEVADHIEIKVEKRGDRIIIETHYLKMVGRADSFWEKLLGAGPDSYGSVDYHVIVPSNFEVDIENVSGDVYLSKLYGDMMVSGSSGDFNLNDIEGRVDIETASGDIELTDIKGDVDISATSADISINSIVGAVDIRSTSGNITGGYVMGPFSISQTSGDSKLTDISGDVRIKSTSGDIEIGQESGCVEISTSSGDVKVKTELDSSRDFFVETSSGRVEFMVPETSSGFVRLETSSGSINTDLPVSINQFSRSKITGSFGEGGPRIYLLTTSGDIRIGNF